MTGGQAKAVPVIAIGGDVAQNTKAVGRTGQPDRGAIQFFGTGLGTVVAAAPGLVFQLGVEHQLGFVSTGTGQAADAHGIGTGSGNGHVLQQHGLAGGGVSRTEHSAAIQTD